MNPRPRVLIPTDELERRIGELALEIDRDYRDAVDPLAVGVLKGSIFFMVELLRRIETPFSIDFLQTSSYRTGTRPGEVRIHKDLEISLRGRDLLLIEDIVDTGHTLNAVLDLMRFRGARSVKLAALLDKAEAREVEVPVDYRGFTIDNVFVVGFGLDLEERYRTLPYVGIYEGEEAGAAAEEEAP